MKNNRNCNANYPVYPQVMPFGYPNMGMYPMPANNEGQYNNIEQQLNSLEQRVNRLEAMINNLNNNNTNKYNDSNYYMV